MSTHRPSGLTGATLPQVGQGCDSTEYLGIEGQPMLMMTVTMMMIVDDDHHHDDADDGGTMTMAMMIRMTLVCLCLCGWVLMRIVT